MAPGRHCLVELLSASVTRGCHLRLWSPPRLAACPGVLRELRAFRREVYCECGFIPAAQSGADDSPEAADHAAWHLLAIRRDNGALAGCIRFIVFERARSATVPAAALANSGCRFIPEDHERCLRALRNYCERWQRRSGPFVQIGGLAIAPNARRSALAPILCLGGNAFMRACASRFGVLFASERTTAGGRLYMKAGSAPMSLEDGLLPPLVDLFHDDRAIVMRLDPYTVRPDLEPAVAALQRALGGQLSELEENQSCKTS